MFLVQTQSTFSHPFRIIFNSVKKNKIQEGKNKSFDKLFAIKLIMIIPLIIFCMGLTFPIVSPEMNGKIIITNVLSSTYSIVCHQSKQSLVYFNNYPTLVCARCLGIYFGALLLLVITMIKSFKTNVALRPLFILSAPLMIDAFAVRLGLYSYSKTIAFITGLLFGAIVLFYILETIESSFYNKRNEKYGF